MKKIEYFGATWCAPCQIYEPVISSLIYEYPDIKFEFYDMDYLPADIEEYGIGVVPALRFSVSGVEMGRLEGSHGSAVVEEQVEIYFAEPVPPVSDETKDTNNEKWLFLLFGLILTKIS